MADNPFSNVERLLARDAVEDRSGKPLDRQMSRYQRSLENYLKGGVKPRWMERVSQIDRAVTRLRGELTDARERLRAQHSGDPAAFAERWTEYAHTRRFDELNLLVRQHNEWYPIERQLPVNPRTGQYVLLSGRSYRREPIDAAWILREFPPVLED